MPYVSRRPDGTIYGCWATEQHQGQEFLPEAEPEPTLEGKKNRLQAAVQEYLDSVARLNKYDNIRSAALRAAYPGPWQAEGIAYAQWMDACWNYCFIQLAAFESGSRTLPTESQLISELPAPP